MTVTYITIDGRCTLSVTNNTQTASHEGINDGLHFKQKVA